MPAGKLAQVLAQQGKHAEAEKMFRGLLASTTLLLGQEHPETLGMAAGVAASLVEQETYAEAEEILVPMLAARKQVTYTHTHACIHTFMHACMHACTHARTHARISVCACMHEQMAHACMNACALQLRQARAGCVPLGRSPLADAQRTRTGHGACSAPCKAR